MPTADLASPLPRSWNRRRHFTRRISSSAIHAPRVATFPRTCCPSCLASSVAWNITWLPRRSSVWRQVTHWVGPMWITASSLITTQYSPLASGPAHLLLRRQVGFSISLSHALLPFFFLPKRWRRHESSWISAVRTSLPVVHGFLIQAGSEWNSIGITQRWLRSRGKSCRP